MSTKAITCQAVAPAKVNLLLSVHGKREDGFHELTSIVAPLKFGDLLSLQVSPGAQCDMLECDDPELPCGPENLVLRALTTFREAYPEAPYFAVTLQKRIPVGAGLGGGSSDAVTAIKLANEACGSPLAEGELAELVGSIGSDCPLFLHPAPKLMTGRGESLAPLPDNFIAWLRTQKIALFKPSFGIGTAWAYQKLAAEKAYSTRDFARKRILQITESDELKRLKSLFYNDFEKVAEKKFLGLSLVLDRLRTDFALPCLMSGSGSACLILGDHASSFAPLRQVVEEVLGGSVFWVESSFA